MKTLITHKCLTCSMKFSVNKSEVSRGGGKYCTRKCSGKARSLKIMGENNPLWKSKPTYRTIHQYIARNFGKPESCEACGIAGKLNKGGRWTIQWANISGNYLRERSDWRALCSKCHNKFDNIPAKVWEARRRNGE